MAKLNSESESKPTVVALVGPTCSGKTALSFSIAERFVAEIIACDSRTVYKHMDIGTAKPTHKEQLQVPHHLIDVVDPDQIYTVAEFKNAATKSIAAILQAGKLPIVCGGTGFYARSLLEGLDMPEVPPQAQLRDSLREFAEQMGNQALHDKLRAIDPQSADRININDRFRIIRAIEVSEIVGKPFSQVATRTSPPYKTIWIGLNADDRANLYTAIDQRFQKQLDDGLIEEVESVFQRYGPTQTILNTVNYREFVMYLQGQIDKQKAIEESIRHNYHLARRQLIWFRANPLIRWFSIDRLSKLELQTEVIAHIALQHH